MPFLPPSSCARDTFTGYDRDVTHYTDDVRVSANTEASIDFTATGMLAFASPQNNTEPSALPSFESHG